EPGAPLEAALDRWPGAEVLLTSRYHAAITGAWAGSRVVVIGINEKLRGAAEELGAPLIGPAAGREEVERALREAVVRPPPRHLAEAARAAVARWHAAARAAIVR
ncbi:MAG: hypothetical protein ACKPB0_16385, partial [Opitutaceae bacterium]